jgi:glutathione S-transferase
MLTLYSSQLSGNCYKVRLLLTQLGIPFRVVEIDVVKGEQHTPEYRAKNPNARVPMVELENGELLPESGAILYYFARHTPLWPLDPLLQARVLQWMFFEQYSHEPYIAVARFWVLYLKAEEKYREQLIEKHKGGNRALAVMEGHLRDRRYFVGERYSIADIALYAYTHVAPDGGFSLEPYPAVGAWLKRVEEQPRHIPITHPC